MKDQYPDLMDEFHQRVVDKHPTKFVCNLKGRSGVISIDLSPRKDGMGLFGKIGHLKFLDAHPSQLAEMGIEITKII